MPLHLFDPLGDLASRIRTGRRVLLFVDFDGTLVPIRDDPTACELSAEGRDLLGRIAAHPNARAAVVSGRDLPDLRPRVGVTGIAYAGNHGLEIQGPGFEFREPGAAALVEELAAITAELTAALADVPGAWVQNKVLSASVHFRQTPPALVPRVKEVVEQVVGPHRERFVLRGGKMVREVRPAVDWHKGRAVRWLWERLTAGDPNPVAIYLGDDATDEDAFRAIPDGVTVMVGPSRQTAARYRLDGPPDVTRFLSWLADVL
ncbi:MAG TPA: trehalose-phosphatase [Fimbriiglobus sp.]|nr:trehalose-phosphatase [Fimbriiglobus sp.]